MEVANNVIQKSFVEERIRGSTKAEDVWIKRKVARDEESDAKQRERKAKGERGDGKRWADGKGPTREEVLTWTFY